MSGPAYRDPGRLATGHIRTVLGDLAVLPEGAFFPHEHLMLHSPLIAAVFPHILLDDIAAAERELKECLSAGVAAVVDAMPASCGRDVLGLAEVSRRTRVPVLASTGLHHDRYYGSRHWSNNVTVDEVAELFITDLTVGIDEFDYTSPIIRRTEHRAGLIKIATSGQTPDARDIKNMKAAGAASAATGCPVLTHCENGLGAMAQLDLLATEGVPAGSVLISHTDKVDDLGYVTEVAAAGAILEFDQTIRQRGQGVEGISLRLLAGLIEAGYEDHIVVSADAARRSMWHSYGGGPGLAWLTQELPLLLAQLGLSNEQILKITRENARRAYTWR